MKRMSFIFESCKEAIRVAFLGFFFIAIGFLIKNESINIFYTFKSTFVLYTAEYCLKIGECIVVNLPIIFMLNLVCKKTNSAFPLISALLGYFAFLVATMIFAPTNLDSNAYITNSFINSVFGVAENATRLPLNTGLLGSFIVAFITRYTFIRSRHNNMTYANNYFDKDLFGMFLNIVLCTIAGILMSFVYPTIYLQFIRMFEYIASSLSDPLRIGIYGVLDRFFSILGMPNVIKNSFYYTSMGGSITIQSTGQTVVGDVNIWNAVKDMSGSFTAGRFITPYYVINIFVIPFIYFGIYKTITNKKEKGRFLLVFILLSILSVVCGNPLPAELFLLFSAPLLLIAYLVIVGVIFGVLTYFEVFLGSNIIGYNVFTVMPGNLPDYLINLRNVYHLEALRDIAIVGVIFAVVIYLVVYVYFHFIAIDDASLLSKNGFANEIYDAIGGKDNIESCTSGLFRVIIETKEFDKIDFEKVKSLNSSRIFETKSGINIDVGSSAFILAKTINNDLKK